MAKKKATKKPVTKKTKKSSKKKAIPSVIELKLDEIEKRLVRIEKLVMLQIDESILAERERERVKEIERIVKDGNFDELSRIKE